MITSAGTTSLLSALLAQLDGARPKHAALGEVSAAHYLDRAHFERERAAVFARFPQLIASEREVAVPGARLAVETPEGSQLLVRGEDGRLRAFKNACRHRSTRLVAPGPACVGKAIICPYHAWTY